MDSRIKKIYIFLCLCVAGCDFCNCDLPELFLKDIPRAAYISEEIILYKNLYSKSNQTSSFERYGVGKDDLPNNLKHVEAFLVNMKVVSFSVEKDNVVFCLESESNFFQGKVVEKKVYYSPSGMPPDSTPEDGQIKIRCYEKISEKFWYVVEEISE